MSRIGKKIINIPSGVEVKLIGDTIQVKGSKAVLEQKLHPRVKIKMEGDSISVEVKDKTLKTDKALWGLFRSLINNMVIGVTQGYEKKLEVNGVGFKVSLAGNKLTMNLGFSHDVNFVVPEGVACKVEKNVIILTSADKQKVGETAAQIRALKKPDAYLGKGIKYADEVLRLKAGKTAAAKAA